MKIVARDYFAAFRWSKIKESFFGRNFSSWWWIMYVCVLMPIMTPRNWERGPEHIFQHICVSLIVMFGAFAAPLHPIALPKMMYLCPMDENERKNYLQKSFLFKIFAGFVISVLAISVLVLFTGLDVFYGAVVVLAEMFFVLCSANIDSANIEKCVDGQHVSFIYGGEDVWAGVIRVVSLGYALFIVLGVGWQEDFRGGMGAVFVGIMLVLETPLTIRMLKKSKLAMEAAVRYER